MLKKKLKLISKFTFRIESQFGLYCKFYDFVSSRVLLHYAQNILSGQFRQFNYGLIKNRQVYGRDSAPDLNIGNVTSRHIYLLQGLNDILAAPQDIRRLAGQLKCKLSCDIIINKASDDSIPNDS